LPASKASQFIARIIVPRNLLMSVPQFSLRRELVAMKSVSYSGTIPTDKM
jgi:hypothetical protein